MQYRFFNSNPVSRLAMCWLALLVLWGASASVFAEEVVITQAKANYQKLSLANARAVFSMRVATWPDGAAVHVFVLPDRHALHANFVRNKLNMFPYQLRREWDRQVYSGVGVAPTEVPDAQTMKMLVAQTPGSIGYIDQGDVDESVQVLQIQ
ncbi:MAG TPA: hypothetical protein VFM46_16065 [Pseudomonadales bacterium]|nr:hypothetical protein [Pseudomonadales bacterium]